MKIEDIDQMESVGVAWCNEERFAELCKLTREKIVKQSAAVKVLDRWLADQSYDHFHSVIRTVREILAGQS